jgi:hypothetical protein
MTGSRRQRQRSSTLQQKRASMDLGQDTVAPTPWQSEATPHPNHQAAPRSSSGS